MKNEPIKPTNSALKAIGWHPELHLVPCKDYQFQLVLDNGDIRTFAIFTQGIENYPLLIVHFDPEIEDEVNVFGSTEARGFASRAKYLGTALPIRTKLTGRPGVYYHQSPHHLSEKRWFDVKQLAEQKTCYLRDVNGRLAFGYRDMEVKGGWAIISGPPRFEPVEFQCAEPVIPSIELTAPSRDVMKLN